MKITESDREAIALSQFTKTIIQVNHTLGILSTLGDRGDRPPAEKIYSWITNTLDGLRRLIPPLRDTYTLKSAAWFNRGTVVTYATLSGRTWTDIVLKAAESTLTVSTPFDFLPSNDELQRNPMHGCRFLANNGYASTQIAPHLEIEFETVLQRFAAHDSRRYSMKNLCKMIGVEDTETVRKYLLGASLPTATRGGGKSFELSGVQVVTFLNAVISRPRTPAHRDAAVQSLRDLVAA